MSDHCLCQNQGLILHTSAETSNLASEGERSFSLQNDPDIDAMRFQNRISPSHLSFRTSSDHSERKASERVKPGSWPAPPPPGSGPRSVGPSRQSLTNGKLDDDRLSLDGRCLLFLIFNGIFF